MEAMANLLQPASNNRWAVFSCKKATTRKVLLCQVMCITNSKQRKMKLFSCRWNKELAKTAWLEAWFLTPAPKLAALISLNNSALSYYQKKKKKKKNFVA